MPTPLILIVEDEPDVLRLLARSLEGHGYAFLLAGSAREALGCIAQLHEPPDLAIIDRHLQDADGETLATTLGRDHPDLPVLFLSGDGTIERRAEGPLLLKPFTPDAFARCVDEYLTTGCCKTCAPAPVKVWDPLSLPILPIISWFVLGALAPGRAVVDAVAL